MTQPATIVGLQHVSVPRPRGRQEESRRFYTDLLGLQELPLPTSAQGQDLTWYRLGEAELHVVAVDAVPQGVPVHFCMQVSDLPAIRTRLTDAGVPIIEAVAIHNRPRFFILDPFGNRMEITAILGPYS